jgi:hypothetical protein
MAQLLESLQLPPRDTPISQQLANAKQVMLTS